ncbi:hypothetical protein ES288_A04G003700v1 [Gossypium darwinii]|uniref:NB-ARC domain-containing protein n=1 Tax=Gossypium darwinii TaxID=34276 RepID=A0A5D2GSQ8_GOSDA|nr:hypothetical protein ES288_A04G003700v1 [Gossypium darwinii]
MAEAIASDITVELITKLSSFAVSQIGLWWNVKDDLDDLRTTVSTIKAVLLDAEEKSVTNNFVKVWLQELKDVLYDADDLLDDFSTETLRKDLMGGKKLMKEVRLFFSSSNQFAYGLKIGRKIKAIKARLASIESKANTFSFMVRRDNDKAALLKLVLEFESEENVYIILIVRFGGLGKTALAQFVYNDEMVKNHFELMMWVCVSDVFDVKLIVKNIIESATGQAPDQNLKIEQLQKQLREKIGGKKYLLVLDDIWNDKRENWVSLKELLIGGARGSRIIITTRSFNVAKITSKCHPHVLKGLSDFDAWSLFKEIAFEQRYADSTDLAFVKIGQQILERCSGVPLVIRMIASTLFYKETKKEWCSFKDNELARISQKEDNILPTLKLSYDHLSAHLKHCFTYCRLYPKDYEIVVQTLVQFWIAQGFIKQSNGTQSLQEIGFGYFKELAERSFFQEVKGKNFMICKMHDLMHDLAEFVAGKESVIVDSNSSASEVDEKCRHISINDDSLILLFIGKKLRTLLQFSNERHQDKRDEIWHFIISNYRCLRVLKLNYFDFSTIPLSIHKLKHLRYLDVSGIDHEILPKSICKIQNLKVLKLDQCRWLKELPKKIEKLVNLTHLKCYRCDDLTHMPRGIGKLTSLEELSMFVVDRYGSHDGADLSELSGLNNLRGQLKITNLRFVKNTKEKFKTPILEGKQHLGSLILQWNGDNDDDDNKLLKDLRPHLNLKKLQIYEWGGDAKFPSLLSLLTNLVDINIEGPNKVKYLPSVAQLPLHGCSPKGSQGEPESFFPSLKYLQLVNCRNMKSWWTTRKPIDDDSDEDDTTVMGTSTMAFLYLSTLWIQNFPLTSMPLYPSVDGDLRLVNTSSLPFKRTIKMNMKQQTVAQSIAEAEYIAAAAAVNQAIWLRKLLYDLNEEQLEPTEIKVGNQSAVAIAKNPIFHGKTKHFKIKFHFVREAEQTGEVSLVHCSSQEQLADILTKPLGISRFEALREIIDESLQHLTSLKRLTIDGCTKVDLEGMQWEPLKNLSFFKINNIPQLVSLPLGLQQLVELKTLEIHNCNGLRSLFPFSISNCNELELSAPKFQIFQDHTSLRSLSLENIPKCWQLPEWIQHLTNLQELSLRNLPNLTSRRDAFRKEIGADWHKIAHIPHIYYNYIQL